ncbi:MAG: DUF3644 domain-containing protein [Micromonosporaceae bacterium]
MNLRQDARHLKVKSISSMRSAMTASNSPDDDGRVTRVLLHVQHAFEMVLKAALVQDRMQVFDKKNGRSIGFGRCLHEARQSARIKLTEPESGTLRAIDAMRDDEQHWYTLVEEGLLYLHARAAVTLFDDLLHRAFGERLADHLPLRVLPIGTEPPQDFQTLVDREYDNIAELLKPKRRAGAEAAARVRALLAMEAHVEDDATVSDADVRRVVRGIREGKTRSQVFPRLAEITATVAGEGLSVVVRFVKKGGLPVRLVKDGDQDAIREVDLQKKYHRSATDLAEAVTLTLPKSAALRRHLGIDADPACVHTFTFKSQKLTYYSDNAFTRMRDALNDGIEMDAVWASHGTGKKRGPRPPCTQTGCQVRAAAS